MHEVSIHCRYACAMVREPHLAYWLRRRSWLRYMAPHLGRPQMLRVNFPMEMCDPYSYHLFEGQECNSFIWACGAPSYMSIVPNKLLEMSHHTQNNSSGNLRPRSLQRSCRSSRAALRTGSPTCTPCPTRRLRCCAHRMHVHSSCWAGTHGTIYLLIKYL